jgi:hypothetical protein
VDLDYKNAMHFSVDGKTSFEVGHEGEEEMEVRSRRSRV